MDIEVIKDQICDVCHKMWQLGWVAANDGNVSAKLDDGTSSSELTLRAMFLKQLRDFVRQAKSKCT